MPRQGYLLLYASPVITDMFNEFVRNKKVTKTKALDDMLEMYMIANDPEMYMELKKKYLHLLSVENLIVDKDMKEVEEDYFLFIKLCSARVSNSEEYFNSCIKDDEIKGYTWFSAYSLFSGMSMARADEYNSAILQGKDVKILFIMDNGEYCNKIAYIANIKGIVVNKYPIPCPESSNAVWKGSELKSKIWLKLFNIKEDHSIKVEDLKISSTGHNLGEVLHTSGCHFGYVTRYCK